MGTCILSRKSPKSTSKRTLPTVNNQIIYIDQSISIQHSLLNSARLGQSLSQRYSSRCSIVPPVLISSLISKQSFNPQKKSQIPFSPTSNSHYPKINLPIKKQLPPIKKMQSNYNLKKLQSRDLLSFIKLTPKSQQPSQYSDLQSHQQQYSDSNQDQSESILKVKKQQEKSTNLLSIPIPTNSQISTLRNNQLFSVKCLHTSIIKRTRIRGIRQINQYSIKGFLGKGAFGKVYKVQNEKSHVFAMKVYDKRILRHRWIGKSKTAQDAMRDQISFMENLQSPYIVKLFQVIENQTANKVYMIMEFANGGTLFDKIPAQENQAKKYFKQLVLGVEYLHQEHQIIHRDIKPQNILLDQNGNLKISDFGCAQNLNCIGDIQNSSSGTLNFMAPELMSKGQSCRGKPIDIWACGITLYYLLMGKVPFKSRKIVDLAWEVKNEEIEIPMKFGSDLASLLAGMLEKTPQKRLKIGQIKFHPWVRAQYNK